MGSGGGAEAGLRGWEASSYTMAALWTEVKSAPKLFSAHSEPHLPIAFGAYTLIAYGGAPKRVLRSKNHTDKVVCIQKGCKKNHFARVISLLGGMPNMCNGHLGLQQAREAMFGASNPQRNRCPACPTHAWQPPAAPLPPQNLLPTPLTSPHVTPNDGFPGPEARRPPPRPAKRLPGRLRDAAGRHGAPAVAAVAAATTAAPAEAWEGVYK